MVPGLFDSLTFTHIDSLSHTHTHTHTHTHYKQNRRGGKARRKRLKKQRKALLNQFQIDIDAMPSIPEDDSRLDHDQEHLFQFIATVEGDTSEGLTYSFRGRTKKMNSDVKVETEWMTENGMGKHFQNYLIKVVNTWKPHPVGRSLPGAADIQVNKLPDGSRFYSHGSENECTPCAILSALSHIGANNKEDKMLQTFKEFRLAHTGTIEQREMYVPKLKKYLRPKDGQTKYGKMSFTQAVMALEGTKGFDKVKVKGLRENPFDLLQCEPAELVVAQICAAPFQKFNDCATHDNQHSIVVTRRKIFDANMDGPIVLSEDNLHKCCVGGPEFFFHHVSRAFRYTPTTKTARACEKVIRQRQPVKRKLEPSLKKTLVVEKRIRRV